MQQWGNSLLGTSAGRHHGSSVELSSLPASLGLLGTKSVPPTSLTHTWPCPGDSWRPHATQSAHRLEPLPVASPHKQTASAQAVGLSQLSQTSTASNKPRPTWVCLAALAKWPELIIRSNYSQLALQLPEVDPRLA